MGKRNLRKYKSKDKAKEENMEEEQIEEVGIANISNLSYLLSNLQSSDSAEKENITSTLSSYKFNTEDVTLKEALFNETFIRSLVLLLNDNCFQVKYNTVSALINLIIHYNESEIELLVLTQTSFITVSVTLLGQFLIIDSKNTSEHVKILRTYHHFLDLLMLLFDLYNEDTYLPINFRPIEKCLVELIVTHKDKVNKELTNHISLVLCKIFSVRCENASDDPFIQMYINEAMLVLNGKEVNAVVKASMLSGLFYLICANYELIKQKDASIFQKAIEAIYFGVSSQSIKVEVKALYDMVNGLSLIQENVSMTDNEIFKSKDSADSPEAMVKVKMKEIEYKAKSLCVLMETFSDIIENLDIPSPHETTDSTALYEEADVEEEEMNDNDVVIKEEDTASSFSTLIAKAVTDLFSIDNYSALQKMLNEAFVNNLLNLFCIEYVNDYFINDMDKMLSIKDSITEIEYSAFSSINNLIEKVPFQLSSQPLFLSSFFSVCVSRLQLAQNSKDEDSLSIAVLSLRNLFSKYKQINTVISLASIDYASIFQLISTGWVEAFTRMNLIDVVSFAFSYPGISNEDNMKACLELKGIFFKESRIEVLSHAVNAFMDIYKEDDAALNKNLKASEVIALMKNGVNEFRSKLKQAKLSGEIDQDGYEYCKETLMNMKRFIRYKEASFKQLNI